MAVAVRRRLLFARARPSAINPTLFRGLPGAPWECNYAPVMLRILHLEDNSLDHELIASALEEHGIHGEVFWAKTGEEFTTILGGHEVDLVLCDNGGPDFDGKEALALVRRLQPNATFVYVTGYVGPVLEELKQWGADGVVSKVKLAELALVVPLAFERRGRKMI
jgi:CheY-like chemotaxis protein